MPGFVYLNGRIVKREEALVSAFDRGFLYGDGLFETIRAYDGTPFMLPQHIARMAASARELDIPMPDADNIARTVERLIERNELGDAYVRITLSRGTHTGQLAPDAPGRPTLLIEARELRHRPPDAYERGAVVVTCSFSHDAASKIRRHKTTSYLPSILAKQEAARHGADEGLLADADGHVAEGATSNVFCVRDGRPLTPPLSMNILPGVTRKTVIGLAADAGLNVAEERFTVAEFRSADEAFITNSLVEIMPVRSVDGRDLGRVPGPITSRLARAYRALVERG
jgi:branched-chain amino acid aminotransferase group I